MIVYPNAKINIGLDLLRKREDKFHDLESLFYPIQLCDILEVQTSDIFSYSQSGIPIDGDIEYNLVVKAYRLLQKTHKLPEVKIHLHKQIPFGAGLGGGSSDAAFMLSALNDIFELCISKPELKEKAAELGSDCPFFIENSPMLASGRGEILKPFPVTLRGVYLVLVKPDIPVSTAEAYAGISPAIPQNKLENLLLEPVSTWKDNISNSFEKSVFLKHPEIKDIKEKLYTMGAEYAAMSGSGSSVFGLFKHQPENITPHFKGCFIYTETLLY
ncbi:MAG: 4-(cytidine 5'-diphospho)-2-C-methyl-D-erythritol kinase [Prolixibacteraceae bacterium]|nr:4-(cytidine 5'-diphospho)-2-C-methyl-D-erythritol kinase [Prolixibacteraceae bacterium]